MGGKEPSSWSTNVSMAAAILQDRPLRRRVLSSFLLLLLGMFASGLWVFDRWLVASPVRFVIWWARFIARDFAGAAEVLGALPGHPEGAAPPTTGLSDKLAVSIITYWALDDADRIAELVVEARKSIARLGTTEELLGTQAMMSVAMLAAIEGDTAETERLVQSWFQGIGQDWATRVLGRDKICQPLGMAGAAEAAVKCIRDGLEEPSQIMPFLEPNLPFYDPIRNEPLFVELVEELAN